MWNRLATYGVVMMLAAGCEATGTRIVWPGAVEAEVDGLTGARTGVFRTYGPTAPLAAGQDTVAVTIGYWCRMDEDTDPATATDGIFFQIAMPDTSLLVSYQEAFEELSGQLALLDVARVAVDGRVYAWQYEPRPTPRPGGWFLDGVMGWQAPSGLDTEIGRDANMALMRNGSTLNDVWRPAHDYVTSHYTGRDTLGIELKGVLRFSMEGFAAAADSVRFWCPVTQSYKAWNEARAAYVAALDSMAAAERAAAAAARAAYARRRLPIVQDSLSHTSLGDAGLVSENWVWDFVRFAREHGVVPVTTEEDVRKVCQIWDGFTESEKRDAETLQRLALRSTCDNRRG